MKSRKKGMTLVEVMMALAVVSILALFIFSFLVAGNKGLKGLKENRRNSALIEGVRNELQYNFTIPEGKNKFYINNDSLNMETLKDKDINSLIDIVHDGSVPYIEIQVYREEFYRVVYIWRNGKDEFTGEIYKGKGK